MQHNVGTNVLRPIETYRRRFEQALRQGKSQQTCSFSDTIFSIEMFCNDIKGIKDTVIYILNDENKR